MGVSAAGVSGVSISLLANGRRHGPAAGTRCPRSGGSVTAGTRCGLDRALRAGGALLPAGRGMVPQDRTIARCPRADRSGRGL
ncbi:hypothetical protein Sgou_16960 [Streptomyces gougerotii]|uniref:Uncharacterized protein n=2 Tax=Streptomyces diastaticus group TaxID=2849069 RepID=A0A8H9HMW5_9ACTN|nr:hypothetical protein Srut_00670 [Streptomyces rutgersensis]GFH74718.1 hypothetical protein Sdia_54860 [Streptomyces diastaticus subsp. diastaticus]GFH77026.1 hypothetical protein Sgou_16960 [Streptomyces gougerotii]GGU04885.1 hypothetical protein GCM10015534_03550 [Streptomyces diastaticus subsp. diastaticus]GGU66483.1 hypothetical protein GCM10010227_20260 [Streptomyces gougerotii]